MSPISQPLVPAPEVNIGLRTTTSDGVVFDHDSSLNWSGYVNDEHAYTGVVSHWIQNDFNPCGCTLPSFEGTWVGIGGAKSGVPHAGALIQAGTDLNSSAQHPRAWLEYLNSSNHNPPQYFGNVAVGADIATSVTYDPSSNIANLAMTEDHVYDFNVNVTFPNSSYYDSSTAEFINERVKYAPGLYRSFTNYDHTRWSLARTTTASGAKTITQRHYYSIVLSNDGEFYSLHAVLPHIF
jgi:hypothetical protein